jgi:ABC-type multidrug transport system ATPase subunit
MSGMQRRLSFILGTIGDIKVLLLDEPCTGLDPISRAMVWKEIEFLKKGRVVVLTTHDMEEAEYLSDKILMLSDGVLIAEGSPLAIKSACGEDLKLHLMTKPGIDLNMPDDTVLGWMLSCFPGSKTLSSTPEETQIGIPRTRVTDLPAFISLVETEGILNWSLKSISMEQAFLKMISDGEEIPIEEKSPSRIVPLLQFIKEQQISAANKQEAKPDIAEAAHFTVQFNRGFIQQFLAQKYKIYYLAFGNWISMASMLLAYVFFVILMNAVGQALHFKKADLVKFALILTTPFFAELIVINRKSGLLEIEITHGINQMAFWPALYFCCFVTAFLLDILILYPYTVLNGANSITIQKVIAMPALALYGAHAAGTSAVFFGCVFRTKIASIFYWTLLVGSIVIPFESNFASIYPFVALNRFLVQFESGKHDGIYLILVYGFVGGLILAGMGVLFDYALNNKPKSHKTRNIISDPMHPPDHVVTFEKVDPEVEKALEEIQFSERENYCDPKEHVRMYNVSKKYVDHFAVHDLSIRLFKDEIFVLLGRNGAVVSLFDLGQVNYV